MNILGLNNNAKNFYKENVKKYNFYPYLSGLKSDTVSFGAMKKSKFSGIDLLVVNKFQVPIEKFNNDDDFQNWCNEKADKIKNTFYGGRNSETVKQRSIILYDWFNYIQDETDYNSATKLLIFDGITKNLEKNTNMLPPNLNKEVLDKTLEEIQNKVNINSRIQINFLNVYKKNLQNHMFETGEGYTGWIEIPSFEHDPDNFDKNVKKAKMLSHHNWCTSTYNSSPYICEGDFHIYLEDGKPKLGVRFVKDEIEEIQGEKNNTKIPLKYAEILTEHIKGCKLGKTAEREIKEIQGLREKIEIFKKEKFPQGVENASTEEIYAVSGVKVKKDSDGFLTISEYKSGCQGFSYEDLGIDENKLIEKVKYINGCADFSYSNITELPNLTYIGGCANFGGSKITKLNKLEHISYTANFSGSIVTDLGNLRDIGFNARFDNSIIESLGNLQSIGGNAHFYESKLSDLGKLESIGENVDFSNSNITDTKHLRFVGGTCYVDSRQTKLIEKLRRRYFNVETL